MSRRLGLGNSSDLDEAIDLYSELGNKGSPARTNASYFIYTIAKSSFRSVNAYSVRRPSGVRLTCAQPYTA